MRILRRLAIVPITALALWSGGSALAQSCPEQGLELLREMTAGVRPLSSLQFPAQANWRPFMHQSSPLIAFTYPPDWQAVPLEDTGAIGVLLRSPGAAAALQLYAMRPPGPMTSQQAAQLAVGSLLGQNARTRVLCGQDFQVPGVYPMTVTFLGVTDGTSIAAAVAAITHDPGNGAALWVDTRTVAGPAKQFDGYLQQVFLPVFAQMQMGGSGPYAGEDGGTGEEGDETPGEEPAPEETP